MLLVVVVSYLFAFLSAVGVEAQQQLSSRKLGPSVENPTSQLRSDDKDDDLPARSIILGVASVSVVAIVLLLTFIIFVRQRFFSNAKQTGEKTSSTFSIAGSQPVQFSFKDMVVATNNFSERLGTGILGPVYRGVLSDRETVVAVKQLRNYRGTSAEFQKFLSEISFISHRNLVKLYGFSAESDQEKTLVYEFLPNGSLDKVLFDESRQVEWKFRHITAVSVAQALEYLHQLQPPVVHGDLKASNVLLDGYFQAKICGTALGSLIDRKSLKTALSNGGVHGFVSPEWVADAPLSTKSDVYGFGILLLELVAGRRVIDLSKSSEQWNFVEWARSQVKVGNYVDIIDPRLQSEGQEQQVMKAIDVALSCVQDTAEDRPPISKVVYMLKGIA